MSRKQCALVGVLAACAMVAVVAVAAEPAAGWMVICGTFADNQAGWKLRAKAETVLGGPLSVAATDEYENLTPGLQVLSAGLFASQDQAKATQKKMAAGGVQCYAKKTARRAVSSDDLVFVGDRHLMWFCFRRGGANLEYGVCKNGFGKGRTLLRPKHFGADAVGFGVVRVAHTKDGDDQSPCGDIAAYSGSEKSSQQVGGAVDAKAKSALEKQLTAFLKKRTQLGFPDMKLTRVVAADITGDGVKDVVFAAKAGIATERMQVVGNVLSMVGFVDGKKGAGSVTPIFLHHAAKKKAEQDYYAASIYGRLAGLADVNGDGRTDVLVETGYYEGNGMEAFTIRQGKVKKLAANGCGA